MEWYGSVENRMDEGKQVGALYPDADYRPTTRRHVKEFAKQQAGKSISTEELRAVVDGRMRFEDAGQPLA